MRYRFTVAFALTCAATWSSVGQAQPLTRASAIDRAMAQNPRVAAQRAGVAVAEAQRAQANAARAPSITLDLGIGTSLEAELIEGTVLSTESGLSDFSLGDLSAVFGGELRVIQPLYTFGKIARRRDAAEHSRQASLAQTEMTRAEVALQVATLYEQHLFARDAALFFEEVEHTLERSILSTRASLDAGKGEVTEQDLARLLAAKSTARIALNQARAAMSQTEGGLRAYLGMPASQAFEVSESSLVPLPAPRIQLSALVETGLAERPELAALRHGVAAYDDLSAAERAGYYPDIFAMGFLSAAYTPGREWLDTRYVTDPLGHLVPGALIGLRWTWQGAMSGARAAEVRARASELRYQHEWAVAGIPAEVRKAHEDMHRALEDLAEAADGMKEAKQWLVRASADYAVGLGDSRSVTDAISAYAFLRVSQLDAEMRLNISLAELDKATGKLTDPQGRFYR